MYVLILSLVWTPEQLVPDAIRPGGAGGAPAAGGDADNESSL